MKRAAALLVVLAASTAAADEVPNPDANRLFEEGRARIKTGDYEAGCALLERSYELERAPGTQPASTRRPVAPSRPSSRASAPMRSRRDSRR